MGVLKDALHMAVWQHLKAQPRFQTLLLSLNAPTTGPPSIRQAWSSLKESGRSEGMKKTTGLQAVLMERGDLFRAYTNERGHLLIALTPDAQARDPLDGLPIFDQRNVYLSNDCVSSDTPAVAGKIEAAAELDKADLGSLLQLGSSEGQDPAFAAQFAEALKAVEEHGWSEDGPIQVASSDAAKPVGLISGRASATSSSEPASKKQKVGTTYSVAGDRCAKGGTKGKNGWFQDIIWTPQIAAKQALERQKDAALARALFNAVEIHAGQAVTLSQLGSDYNVAQIKKDAQFKNHKLLDILKYHEDVFELVADSSNTGGFVVKLQPGAEAALPDADTFDNELREADLLLPERIEEPRSPRERMQALRIELVHALHRRGGKVALQELGQEPKVQKIKSGLQKSQKLIDFIKMFPENFKVTSDDATMCVEIGSVDVADQSAIDSSLNRAQAQTQPGKGRQQPRQSSFTRTTFSSSNRGHPSGHYRSDPGFGHRGDLGHSHLGYGHLGAAPPPPSTSASGAALATASAISTLIQHSIANPYGAVPPHPHAYGAPPPPLHGFSPHPPPALGYSPPPPTGYGYRL